jgi:hypothetical protein
MLHICGVFKTFGEWYHIYGAACKARNFNVIYICYPVAQLCVNTFLATKVTLITDGI